MDRNWEGATSMLLLRGVFWTAWLMMLAACGGSSFEALEAQRPQVEAKAGALAVLPELLKGIGSMTPDVFAVEGPAPQFAPAPDANAVAIDLADFEDLSRTAAGGPRLLKRNPVADAVSWGRRGTLANGSAPRAKDKARLEDEVRRFLSLRYVLVLRTTKDSDPKTWSKDTFVGGTWKADAVLLEIVGRKILGGFAFQGKNDAKVRATEGYETGDLLDNLRANALAAARDRFLKSFPNSIPPFRDAVR